MRCLVTGASGQLGSSLVRQLLDDGATVYVLLRPHSDPWRLADVLHRVHQIYGDMGDLRPAEAAIREAAADTVFHLAWSGVTGEARNSSEQITVNVQGGLELFRLVHLAGCEKWIGVGSQAEYGPYPCLLTEDLPTRPRTAYGVAKLSLGLLTAKLCELAAIRFVWFRLLATYGPADDSRRMIPGVIAQLLAGERPRLTPGEQLCDYLHVEDAARALRLAGTMPGIAGTFVLGSGEARTVRNVVEDIRDNIDPSLPLGFGACAYRGDQVMHLVADVRKFAGASGWQPRIRFSEGLSATVEWYQMHSQSPVTS